MKFSSNISAAASEIVKKESNQEGFLFSFLVMSHDFIGGKRR